MATNKEKALAAAQKFLDRGQPDRALAEFARVVQEEPGDTRTWLKMAEIYARRGAPFTNRFIRQFYQRRAWYTPNPNFDEEQDMSLADRRNVLLILLIEKEKGGPPRDIPRVYGAARAFG